MEFPTVAALVTPQGLRANAGGGRNRVWGSRFEFRGVAAAELKSIPFEVGIELYIGLGINYRNTDV